MKIAHLPSNFLPTIGGAQVVAHNVAQQQHEAGHEVHLITRAIRNKKALESLKNNLPYSLLPIKPMTLPVIKQLKKINIDLGWILGKQLMNFQKEHNFDVWHLNMIGPFVLMAFPYIKKMGVPIVATCHGVDIQKIPSINYGRRLNPKFEKALCKVLFESDVITAISDTVKEDYQSLGIPSEKIMSVPNGINFAHINDYTADKTVLRKRLNLPLDKKIIITVGRNHPKKGYKHIPEIIHLLAKQRQDFLWVMVGKGNEKIAREAEAKQLGQYIKVVPVIGIDKEGKGDMYTIPSTGLIALYKAADIFAFPTLIESFGLVNIEAMAAGLPVVVTDAPGCNELVSHRYNGLLSPIGDNQAMADNILEVLEDEGFKNQLIANGLEEAKKYDWKNIAQKYIESYEQAMVPYQLVH